MLSGSRPRRLPDLLGADRLGRIVRDHEGVADARDIGGQCNLKVTDLGQTLLKNPIDQARSRPPLGSQRCAPPSASISWAKTRGDVDPIAHQIAVAKPLPLCLLMPQKWAVRLLVGGRTRVTRIRKRAILASGAQVLAARKGPARETIDQRRKPWPATPFIHFV